MLRFYAQRYVGLVHFLELESNYLNTLPDNQALAQHNGEEPLRYLVHAEKLLIDVDMGVCLAHLREIKRKYTNPDGWLVSTVKNDFFQLYRNIQRELAGKTFLYLSTEESERYQKPLKDWAKVLDRWPKTTTDVIECSKCYALERYAAAIFHVLLIAEFGVIEVGKLMGVAGDRPGWSCLERLERIRNKPYKERSVQEKQHWNLLENTLPLMIAVKDSWRHKLNHIDNKLEWLDSDFSPQLADEIIKATRGLMRRLASDLPHGILR